jgi:alkaline phosphatase D
VPALRAGIFYGPEPYNLEEYRDRHALYKTDQHLQAAHQNCPWLLTWDDHEVDNDYQGVDSEDWEDHDVFVKRRAAAYQAYYEHMPLRHIAVPRAEEMRLYQRSTFGDLIEFTLLDNRQYRSPEACRDKEHGGGHLVTLAGCKELTDPNRSMIGKAQEDWLFSGFSRAKAKWNAIAQSQLFSRLKQKAPDGEDAAWTEDWNGYPGTRERIIARIAQSKLPNPVILGGDIHSFWVNDVKADFNDPESATVATEIVGTSLTSAGPPYELFAGMLPDNPHVKFFESRKRGYVMCEATQSALNAHLRIVDDIRDPKTKDATLAKFTIEAGKPGAVKA